MTLPVKTGSPEVVTAWWNSEDVREARKRAKYDAGEGSLTDVLSHLLTVVDEHEARDFLLPRFPKSDAAKLAARDFSNGTLAAGGATRGSSTTTYAALLQMLDLGADPARLRKIFPDSYVTRALRTYKTWRPELVRLARHGASPEEIHAAIPGVWWHYIREVLIAHGLEGAYPVTAMLSNPRVTPDQVARRGRVIELHKQGLSYSKIATELGMGVANVGRIMRLTREGKFPELVGALDLVPA